jgi:hypothetical protein
VTYGSNGGGSSIYGCGVGDAFETCSGSASGTDCDGPERVYVLDIPNGVTHFQARLRSCEASWLFYHQSPDACPDSGPMAACGYATQGTFLDQETPFQLIGGSQIVFVVEGYQNNGGNFALEVDCSE